MNIELIEVIILPSVTFHREGKIGIIEIDYPATLNSLCGELRIGLMEKLQIAEKTDIRVLILKGNQPSFSTGGDLSELGKIEDPVEAKEYVEGVHSLIKKIYSLSKVTIALVEGYAVGAGLSMATACDLIYAGENAKFSVPFLNVGLVPDCGASYLLTRLVGIQKAKELAFTGKTISALEALQIGLVTNVFSADKVVEDTKMTANKIAQGPPKALAMTKVNFERAAQMGLDTTLTLEENAQGVCIFGKEHIEGRQAFFDKRKPSF